MGNKRTWPELNRQVFPQVWFLEKTSQGAYLTKHVFNAKLDKLDKLYLCYVAAMTNFKDKRPCFASRDEMMNALSMSKETLNRVKNKLRELDWIIVYERPGTSDLQFPAVGEDTPGFKWKVPSRKEDGKNRHLGE